MATLAAVAARRAATLSRTPAPSQAASHIPRRGLAGAADHHGLPKSNFWEDPMNPSKWKEEHFVIVSLSGWGLLFFSGYKFFTRGKGKKEEDLFLYRQKPEITDPIRKVHMDVDSSGKVTAHYQVICPWCLEASNRYQN